MRECVFRCGIRQDGLPKPAGNLSLSERERGRESLEREEREAKGCRRERIGWRLGESRIKSR